MKNFIFKSTNADLQKMFQSIETIQKNVLYLTYRTDMIIKTLNKMVVDKGVQKQVDEYYGPSEWEKDITEVSSKEDLD